jgi:putative transposase
LWGRVSEVSGLVSTERLKCRKGHWSRRPRIGPQVRRWDKRRLVVISTWNTVSMRATVEVRYRYRLRVSNSQAALLQAVFDADRFVWNQALGRWQDLWREERISLSYAAADKELTDWRSRFEWLAEQPSVPQQQVLRDLYRAIAAFYDRTNPTGRPQFKRKGTHATARWTRRGFAVSGSGLGMTGERLEVAVSNGRVPLRVVWSRPLPVPPTSVTVYRDPVGRWWASFVVRMNIPSRRLPPTGKATGLDIGLDTFATVEDPAHDIPNPRLARAQARALARSRRNLARKQKGSANRAKAKRQRAAIEAKLAAQRADFHQKAARHLVGAYDRIGVEDLTVNQLSRRGKGRRKAGLNRAIADAGWARFLRVLEWQALKAGKQVVALPARDTTQQCSTCEAKAKPRLKLSDRVFRCQNCGLVLERDRNSARNLHPDHPRNNRLGCTGAGDDGKKPRVPAGSRAA